MRFIVGLVALFIVAGEISGQDGPGSTFEVASVKQVEDATGIAIRPSRSGNRVRYLTQVRMVIYYAYDMAPYQVTGDLPGEVYSIEAIATDTPTDDQLKLMFRSLLEDRFRLKVHYETKLMEGYELLSGRGGPKLSLAQDGRQVILDGEPTPEGAGAYATRNGPRLFGRKASMTQLAEELAFLLHGPVVNRTEITGTFDFIVAFSNDEPGTAGANTPDLSSAPSLQTAIQEQLGLRLKSGKVPVKTLVIDHVALPLPN